MTSLRRSSLSGCLQQVRSRGDDDVAGLEPSAMSTVSFWAAPSFTARAVTRALFASTTHTRGVPADRGSR
jgi:hypothetical protein